MCDYSLMGVPNRLAQQGEELAVFRFCTGSLGLASAAAVQEAVFGERRPGFWRLLREVLFPAAETPVCAVCIPPGATLRLRDIPPRLQREFGVGEEEEVMFTQLSASANMYRDAMRFDNGFSVRLQELREGQRVRVLDLSNAEIIPDWQTAEGSEGRPELLTA
jgi:hypothetical protein